LSARLREALKNEHRLDLLCRLSAEGPMTVPGLSKRTGMSPRAVAFFLDELEEHSVIRKTGRKVGRESMYEACLDEQPAWVRAAVEKHCPDVSEGCQ
jgi:predicted transcriptional regulator